MKNPRISVCIPTYNYARYLPKAVESVLNQDFTDFELIVIDDHSPDNTAEVMESYVRHDERVRFSVNERNLGMVPNWNLCLERARGEYVKFLFADDFHASTVALSLMSGVLDRHPDVVLVGSARQVVDESSQVKRVVSRFLDRSRHPGGKMVRRSLLEERNLVGEPSAVMFRRQAAVRGFDPAFRQLVDLEMWFHLLGQGSYYHLGTPIVAFREHGEQQTAHNAREGVLFEEMVRLNADYGRRPELVNLFWRWFLACQGGYRIEQLRSRNRSADGDLDRLAENYGIRAVGPASMALYRLIKPLLKGWCGYVARSMRMQRLNEIGRLRQ
ncbi:MAG TPA: glycosyltransferase family 2 protein [Geobacteraceae bacterium]|nr:glycosyltransferase family 2 protein [Geobacteraceae bacterium]